MREKRKAVAKKFYEYMVRGSRVAVNKIRRLVNDRQPQIGETQKKLRYEHF